MPELLTPQALTERYPGTTTQTWANLRFNGTGPKFVKIARRVYYRPEDLIEWEANNVRTRTDEMEVA